MKTPVVLMIFKRPDTTQKVFEVVRQMQPAKLLIIADGPRDERVGEAEKCAATRAVVEQVDWDCEVFRNYSDSNLGCKQRVVSGLNWVFELVEEAIILEDDCLPHPTFFRFCETLLERYQHDERIMSIGGTNIKGEWKSNLQSYHFSYHGCLWGWATWRRAWQHYDITMKLWNSPEIKDRVRDVLADLDQFKLRAKHFEQAYLGLKDAWSYQWRFAMLIQSGLSILPSTNLVSNIGFDAESTHTKSSYLKPAHLETSPCRFPLEFNEFVAVDRDYDRAILKNLTRQSSLTAKISRKLIKLFPDFPVYQQASLK